MVQFAPNKDLHDYFTYTCMNADLDGSPGWQDAPIGINPIRDDPIRPEALQGVVDGAFDVRQIVYTRPVGDQWLTIRLHPLLDHIPGHALAQDAVDAVLGETGR